MSCPLTFWGYNDLDSKNGEIKMGIIIWKPEVEAPSSEVAVEIRVSGSQKIAINLVPFGHKNGRLKNGPAEQNP